MSFRFTEKLGLVHVERVERSALVGVGKMVTSAVVLVKVLFGGFLSAGFL